MRSRTLTFRAVSSKETEEAPDKAGEQPIGSKMRQALEGDLPLEVAVTSRLPSSSEVEDEECKLGIEGRESILLVVPSISPEIEAEDVVVREPYEERRSIE